MVLREVAKETSTVAVWLKLEALYMTNSLATRLYLKKKLYTLYMTPDVTTYGNVIKAYCRSGKLEEAKRVFSEMEDKNCSPDLVTYNLLIGGLCRHGLVNEAIDYKNLMIEKGLIPNEYTYTCLIQRFVREGKIEEALRVKEDMVANNCEPQSTLQCINILMRDLLKLNKMDSFWNVCEKLLDDKLEPKAFTYTNVIGGYLRDGEVDEAKKLFSEMEKGFNPSVVTYNLLISGLCKTGFVDEAFELKFSMAKNGLRPDIYAYTNLIDRLCKLKRSHDAKILGKGVMVDVATYATIIDGYCNQGIFSRLLSYLMRFP